MPVVVDDVAFGFTPGEHLFSQVSFIAREGQLIALTGPSGSGKSTFLSVVAGWRQPTKGTVTLPQKARVCWVFQNPSGVPFRTVLDHVALPILAQGRTRREASQKAYELLSEFSLEDVADKRFGQISGGQAQRLMLARAVAVKPAVLLIDEPTAQLDQKSAVKVADTILHVTRGGTIALVATHDPMLASTAQLTVDLGLR